MTGERIRHMIERIFPVLLGIFAISSPLTRAVQDVGFPVCFVLFVAHRYCDRSRPAMRKELRPFYLALAVYLGMAIISLTYSADPVEGENQFMQLNMLLLCMIFAERISPMAAWRALWLFVGGTSMLATIVLYQGIRLHVDRPPTIMHYVHGGIVLLFGMTVLLSLLTGCRGWLSRSVVTGLLVLHGWALYLNGTRAAWAGAAVVLILCPLLVPALTWRRKAAYLATTVAVMVVFSHGSYARYKFQEAERDVTLYQAGRENTSVGGRFEMWKASLLMYRQHPILGVGLGGWQQTLKQMVRRDEAPEFITQYNQTHNVYLDALSTRGIPGLLSLLALLVYPVIVAVRVKDPRRSVFRLALILLGTAALITGCADTLVRLRLPFMCYIIVTAAAFAGLVRRDGCGSNDCTTTTPRDDAMLSHTARS